MDWRCCIQHSRRFYSLRIMLSLHIELCDIVINIQAINSNELLFEGEEFKLCH